MRPIHTHTHTHYILLYLSQLLYPPLSSSVITSPSHTRSLAVFISLSYTDRNTQLLQAHTTSFCYRHAKSCRKHKGSSFSFFFFNPGTKKKKQQNAITWDKSADIWRWGCSSDGRLGCSLNEQEARHRRIDWLLSLSGLLILLFSHFCFPSSPPFIPHSYPTTLPICISLSCSSHPPTTSGLHSSIPLSSSSTCPGSTSHSHNLPSHVSLLPPLLSSSSPFFFFAFAPLTPLISEIDQRRAGQTFREAPI